MLLVKGAIDCADEFDCQVFGIFSDSKWKELCDEAKARWPSNFRCKTNVGTNEYLSFSSYEDWVRNFQTVSITDEQAVFLTNQFGTTWGTGRYVFNILDELPDDEQYRY